MSVPSVPEPACLVISLLSSRSEAVSMVKQALEEEFGSMEEVIGPLEFTFTNYYDSELGQGISRHLLVFNELIDRSNLCRVKLMTNDLERVFMHDQSRVFNLDPGLLTLGNFVLATGKNNAHRIYLDHGIFADLTLIFRRGSFRALEWTYPDYSDQKMIETLNLLREKYKCKLMRLS